jgi:hypothetical protein
MGASTDSARSRASPDWDSGTCGGDPQKGTSRHQWKLKRQWGASDMVLTRQEIVEMLRDNGDLGTAHQAEAQLPETVNLDKDRELLQQHGIDIEYLLSRR